MSNINPLLDGIDEIETVETPATVVMRPTVDLPLELRMNGTTYWASEGRQSQYSGFCPEMGCYARIYGPWADKIFAKYGAAKANNEKTGNKVTLSVNLYPNSNGLFFAARKEGEVDYVSLNEYAIKKLKLWTPDIEMA